VARARRRGERSVTEQWAAAALSGPKSRDVLAQVVDIDVGNAAFPFLAVAECSVRTAVRQRSGATFPDELFG
jgi:sarcosine oxidase subunit alpha